MAKIRDIYFFFKIWWGGNSWNKYDVVCMYLNFVLNKIYNRFLNPIKWYIMINVQCNKTMKWSEIDWIYKIHLIFVAVIDTASYCYWYRDNDKFSYLHCQGDDWYNFWCKYYIVLVSCKCKFWYWSENNQNII